MTSYRREKRGRLNGEENKRYTIESWVFVQA